MSFDVVVDATTGEAMVHNGQILIQDLNNPDERFWCDFTQDESTFNVIIESATPAYLTAPAEGSPCHTSSAADENTSNVEADSAADMNPTRERDSSSRQREVDECLDGQLKSVAASKLGGSSKEKNLPLQLQDDQQEFERKVQESMLLHEEEMEEAATEEPHKITLYSVPHDSEESSNPDVVTVIPEDYEWDEQGSPSAASGAGKKKLILWKRRNNLELINLYKEALPLFKSTTIKKKKVWQQIAEKMKPFTASQCENKFKYLKKRYIDKVANMRNSDPDTKRLVCEYFEELDSIFHASNNVYPQHLTDSDYGGANIPQKFTKNHSVSWYELETTVAEDDYEFCFGKDSRDGSREKKPKMEVQNQQQQWDEVEAKKQRLQNRVRIVRALEKIADSFAVLIKKI